MVTVVPEVPLVSLMPVVTVVPAVPLVSSMSLLFL